MRTNLDRFRDDHAEILSIVLEIQHLLTPSEARKKAGILQGLIGDLTLRTLAHLLLEDRCLYQEMLLSPHDDTRTLAQQQVISMGSLAGTLRNYLHAWYLPAQIASQPETFCDETKAILAALEMRISREERLVYPKAEEVTR